MISQIDIWEKEKAQSKVSFSQNIELKIKAVEVKLEKLVTSYLDCLPSPCIIFKIEI